MGLLRNLSLNRSLADEAIKLERDTPDAIEIARARDLAAKKADKAGKKGLDKTIAVMGAGMKARFSRNARMQQTKQLVAEWHGVEVPTFGPLVSTIIALSERGKVKNYGKRS